MSRRKRLDWFSAGFALLETDGLSGLTIEAMSTRLSVTKGSFYHHFENIADFRMQLLEHWAGQYTITGENIPTSTGELSDLLDALITSAYAAMTGPEPAIRNWAGSDASVKPYVEAVDRHRRSILHRIISGLVPDSSRAGMIADILFSVMIGSLASVPRTDPDRVISMYRDLKTQYRLGE